MRQITIIRTTTKWDWGQMFRDSILCVMGIMGILLNIDILKFVAIILIFILAVGRILDSHDIEQEEEITLDVVGGKR